MSACCLSLVPGYLAAVVGPARDEGRRRIEPAVVGRSLLFVASLSFVFILLGLSATAAGSFLSDNQVAPRRVAGGHSGAAGAILIAIGVLVFTNELFRLNIEVQQPLGRWGLNLFQNTWRHWRKSQPAQGGPHTALSEVDNRGVYVQAGFLEQVRVEVDTRRLGTRATCARREGQERPEDRRPLGHRSCAELGVEDGQQVTVFADHKHGEGTPGPLVEKRGELIAGHGGVVLHCVGMRVRGEAGDGPSRSSPKRGDVRWLRSLAFFDALVLATLLWAAVSGEHVPLLALWPTHGVLYLLALATSVRSASEAGVPWRVVSAVMLLGPLGAVPMLELSLRRATPTDEPAQE